MSLVQGYLYVFSILDEYWEKVQKNWDDKDNDGLASLLTEMEFPGLRHDEERVYTLDPAVWHHWTEAVAKVTPNKRISDNEAKKAIIEMMLEYQKQGFELNKTIKYTRQLL